MLLLVTTYDDRVLILVLTYERSLAYLLTYAVNYDDVVLINVVLLETLTFVTAIAVYKLEILFLSTY